MVLILVFVFLFFALHGGKKPHQSCETLSMDEHGAAALSMIKSIALGHMLNTQYRSAYLSANYCHYL